MAQTVVLPKLGMTMEAATIQVWLKGDGDLVEPDEPILTIETEKAIAEVPSPVAGLLITRAVPGEVLAVGAPIAEIAADRAEYDAIRAGGAAADGVVSAATGPAPQGAAATERATASSAVAGSGPPSPAGKVRVAPAARALASERGIDLALVTATGPEGRITKDDVLAYDRARAAAPAAPDGEAVAGAQTPAGAQPPAASAPPRSRLIPRSARRRIVAGKMMEAMRESAQATHAIDIDATAIVALRAELVARAAREGSPRVTITDLVMKVTALALRQHPILNSRYTDEGDLVFDDVHMGMATSVREGELLVPVISAIDRKSPFEIAAARIGCLERAREDRLAPDELTGGTFTVSSLGMFGLDRFVAVLNRPENAILAVGAILDRPWVHHGQVVVRPVMSLTLTYDHRTIYGVEAARFMATLKSLLENPPPL